MNSFDWIQSERKQSTKQCTKIDTNDCSFNYEKFARYPLKNEIIVKAQMINASKNSKKERSKTLLKKKKLESKEFCIFDQNLHEKRLSDSTESLELKNNINEYITKLIKSKKFKIAKEVVVPSLQNFKTDPKLFYSPKNIPHSKINKWMNQYPVMAIANPNNNSAEKSKAKQKKYFILNTSDKFNVHNNQNRLTSACKLIQAKHLNEGIMRRNKLLIEHIVHERIKNRK